MLCAVVIAGATSAEALRPAARLDYLNLSGAQSCPDEPTLRQLVAAQMGYDPFTADAATTISVSIEETPDKLLATVRAHFQNGHTAQRSLRSANKDCRELAASTAFAIALAVDPLLPQRRRAPAVPTAQAAPERAAAPVPPPRGADVGVEAELLLGLGQAPEVGFGGALRVSLLSESFLLTLEARADMPSSLSIPGGRVGASLFAGVAAGCYRWKALQACALIGLGALRAFGSGFPGDAVRWLPWVGAGARAAVRVPLSTSLYLEAHGDLIFPLVRSALLVGDVEVWRMSIVGGTIGLGLGYRLE